MSSLNVTPMNLFPTMDSLEDVIGFAESRVPVNSKNEMYSLLMMYHNTLLKVIHGN